MLDGETGKPVWTSQLGTDGDESIADIALDANGRIYVAANVASYDGTAIDHDVLLMTLDADGKVVGSQQWGSSDTNDIAAAIAVDACGTAAIVGTHSAGNARDAFLLIAR